MTDHRLAGVLSEFARTLGTDFEVQHILDHLVQLIADMLPITSAGVTLISPSGQPQYIAASDASALAYEKLQTDLAEGPCLAAYAAGEAVSVPDLRGDGRFPGFTPLALEAGLMAAFTFPMHRTDRSLGVLDLYRDAPGPLDATDMATAQTLADVAAAYITNAEARADVQAAADQFRELSLHDALTGLPNRVLLRQRLEHAVLRTRRSHKTTAILFADLDNFKQVNDSYGHRVGDELLVAVAERLTGLLRPGDTLARMSGDEFVILCEELDEEAQADAIAERVGKALAQDFTLSIGPTRVTASIGIASTTRGDDIAEQLLHDADVAMYQAKSRGGARHQIVDLRQQHEAEVRANLRSDLSGAMDRQELFVDYQPIVRTGDGAIAGVEALLRWTHPDMGVVPPASIITFAEQASLIGDLGHWVLQQACRDRHRWARHFSCHDLGMSVNVSARQVMSSDFASSVAEVLRETGTAPERLTLELTESVFVEDSDRALTVLDDLKQVGVGLALDDFGTGYSSLSYLKDFPVGVVKIDQRFIAELPRDPTTSTIVSAVVDLAHALEMTVVAEGVETAEQHQLIGGLGCDFCQGFYFAHPRSADEVAR